MDALSGRDITLAIVISPNVSKETPSIVLRKSERVSKGKLSYGKV